MRKHKIRDETPKTYIDSKEIHVFRFFIYLKSKNAKNSVTMWKIGAKVTVYGDKKIKIVLIRAV